LRETLPNASITAGREWQTAGGRDGPKRCLQGKFCYDNLYDTSEPTFFQGIFPGRFAGSSCSLELGLLWPPIPHRICSTSLVRPRPSARFRWSARLQIAFVRCDYLVMRKC